MQYYRVKASVKNNGLVVSLIAANVTDSFNFYVKTTDQTDDNSKKKKKKNIEIMVPLKYLSNFYLIIDQMTYNRQMYTILLNDADNHC